MISSKGVKANMCCASCLHLSHILCANNIIKRWCKKKNKPVINPGGKCGFYVMAEFFQKRGYKPIKD